jgi:hypothetical protein
MMSSLVLWYSSLLLFAIGMGVIARREVKRTHKRT